uniref:Uncharacterized protein n=1 Tax=Timema bartmani TaxID=61472 RepID=A0A7R9EVG8_9NEOP|nr:unnamed protein product [Timema bartmani]
MENSVGFIFLINERRVECFINRNWTDFTFWNPRAFFLLVITTTVTEETDKMADMLRDCWENFNILNLVVIFHNWTDSSFWNPRAFFLLVISTTVTEETDKMADMLRDCWEKFNILNFVVIFQYGVSFDFNNMNKSERFNPEVQVIDTTWTNSSTISGIGGSSHRHDLDQLFDKLSNWTDSPFWNPRAFFLLVITTTVTEETDKMADMLRDCWENFNILNLVVIFQCNVEKLDAHSGCQSQSPRRNWTHNKLWKPVRWLQTRDALRESYLKSDG